MSTGTSWFIIIVTLLSIAGPVWLLLANGRAAGPSSVSPKDTGHVWDGDLREYNNPLPRWWFWLFIITVVFSLVYMAFYPALGNFAGALGWSQANQHAAEVQRATAAQKARYDRYRGMGLPALATDSEAMGTARTLFANYCAACHGSDARGGAGFPNLADDNWLYGGEPDTVLASIANGRMGVMPGWEAALGGEAGVNEVTAYVRSLSGAAGDAAQIAAGQARYAAYCVACHGADGTGNPALGAPNLRDDVWLYGGDEATVRASIAKGRQGQMPAHEPLLGPDRTRLMAAYVLKLSAGNASP
jgi:cytochrome c oxidase cbb3-type subunit 3